jgi:hypothetical protein
VAVLDSGVLQGGAKMILRKARFSAEWNLTNIDHDFDVARAQKRQKTSDRALLVADGEEITCADRSGGPRADHGSLL